MKETLVVNLFGGPGVSKSTNCALTFGKLKVQGVNAEMASEYAKDLVWEERHKALDFQPYICAKQMYRVHRLLGKVDVVLTDSPILFGLIYAKDIHIGWEEWLVDTFNEWNTLNFRLIRDLEHHPYNPKGRLQTKDEAQEVDAQVDRLLRRYAIPHIPVKVMPGEQTADHLAETILKAMEWATWDPVQN